METKIDRYFKEFISENFDKRDKKKEGDIKFEWFINAMHCWYQSSFSYNSKSNIWKDISLGKMQNCDAFLLIIDNKIFTLNDNIDDIIDVLKKNRKIIIQVIQTKNTSKINKDEFECFCDFMLKVFGKQEFDNVDNNLQKILKLIEIISSNSELKNIVWKVELFFYCKKNQNDISQIKDDWHNLIEYKLKAYAEWADIDIKVLGSSFITDTYELFKANDLELYVAKNNLISIDKDKYLIGTMTANELLECIAKTQNNSSHRLLNSSAFENNIRLYLGETPTNKSIEKTLKEEPEKFHLYNNGLTITTKNIDNRNVSNFIINSVNIVNGCQTANSIYNTFKTKDEEKEKHIKIPVRIINVENEEYEKITIRTNTQNGIQEKDLLSISYIQKELEKKFNTTLIQNKTFFYKRQNSSIKEQDNIDFIVNISDILRSSFSCLLLIPHKVSGWFDETTNCYIDTIFDNKFLNIYFILTCLLKITEDVLEDSIKKFKFHIIYIIYKILIKGDYINKINNYFTKNKNEQIDEKVINEIYCNIFSILNSEEKFLKIINYVIFILKNKYNNFLTQEKLIYRTVDDSQQGTQIFKNFKTNFTKNFSDFNGSINE